VAINKIVQNKTLKLQHRKESYFLKNYGSHQSNQSVTVQLTTTRINSSRPAKGKV